MAREPLDLRLVVGAGTAWLAVLCSGSSSPGRVLLLACAAGGLGLVVLLSGRRRSGVAALALALFCIALTLLPLAGRLVHARAAPLYRLARERAPVTLTLTVDADPVPLAARGVAGSPRVLVAADADGVTTHGVRGDADGDVVVLADARGWRDLLPGQRVQVDGRLQPDLDGSALSVTLSASAPPLLLGRPPWWQRLAGSIRSALRSAAGVLPDQERGLLPGLVDGDTAALDPVLAERFRLAGLTHLVAVSGTNCSILVGFVLLVLRRLRARPWICALVGLGVLAMFVVVARPSPSVLRAALMASIALGALATGRPRAALPGLGAAVLALLLWDPVLAANVSFVMSVLATAALLLIAPGWARALRRRHVPLVLAESVAVAAAAHLVTMPVVAAISGQVSLVAVPANVLAEPVVAAITVLGFGAAVLAPLWLPLGELLAWVAGWPCRWLVGVADYFGGLTGAVLPWPGGVTGGLLLLGVTAVVALVATRAGVRRVLLAAAVTAALIAFPVRSATTGWPPAGWVFLACDVGQGDALLLPAGPGAAVVIDTGPDPVVLDRCLRQVGIDQVPLLVLTHFHLDHVGGLPGLVR
ncbi:MAG: ComEC/Rec2 family competence protein, partial [Actinobacteria bacterium]|nr:ComEC/Rec2 family competence protein [Actinomycetota bacterium]